MPLRFFIANESLHRGLKERKITPARTLRCEDRIAGTARNVGGKVQEGVGRVTGDAKSQADGLVNQAAGAAQDFYGQPRSRGLCELRRYRRELLAQSAAEVFAAARAERCGVPQPASEPGFSRRLFTSRELRPCQRRMRLNDGNHSMACSLIPRGGVLTCPCGGNVATR
jgi:uncharacterized protein YjbJ (UPF0337 family)